MIDKPMENLLKTMRNMKTQIGKIAKYENQSTKSSELMRSKTFIADLGPPGLPI